MNILPVFSSKDAYSLQKIQTEGTPKKILKVALRVLLTATLVAPLLIGVHELLRKRIVPLDCGKDVPWYKTAVKIVLTLLLVRPLFYGMHELWSDIPLRRLEQIDSDDVKHLPIKHLNRFHIDLISRHEEIGKSLSLEQHGNLAWGYCLRNTNEYFENLSESVVKSMADKYCAKGKEDLNKFVLEFLFLSPLIKEERARMAKHMTKDDFRDFFITKKRDVLKDVIPHLTGEQLEEFSEHFKYAEDKAFFLAYVTDKFFENITVPLCVKFYFCLIGDYREKIPLISPQVVKKVSTSLGFDMTFFEYLTKEQRAVINFQKISCQKVVEENFLLGGGRTYLKRCTLEEWIFDKKGDEDDLKINFPNLTCKLGDVYTGLELRLLFFLTPKVFSELSPQQVYQIFARTRKLSPVWLNYFADQMRKHGLHKEANAFVAYCNNPTPEVPEKDEDREIAVDENEKTVMLKRLGLGPKASWQDVLKAYKKLIVKCHPDKNPDDVKRAAALGQAKAYLDDCFKNRPIQREIILRLEN